MFFCKSLVCALNQQNEPLKLLLGNGGENAAAGRYGGTCSSGSPSDFPRITWIEIFHAQHPTSTTTPPKPSRSIDDVDDYERIFKVSILNF